MLRKLLLTTTFTLLLVNSTPIPAPDPNVLQDFGQGLAGGIAGFVTSTANAIIHPVATGKGLWTAIKNPGRTLNAIGDSVSECWAENKARCLGSATALVATGWATGAAVGAVSKGLKTSRAGMIAANTADDTANLGNLFTNRVRTAGSSASVADDVAMKQAENLARIGVTFTDDAARMAAGVRPLGMNAPTRWQNLRGLHGSPRTAPVIPGVPATFQGFPDSTQLGSWADDVARAGGAAPLAPAPSWWQTLRGQPRTPVTPATAPVAPVSGVPPSRTGGIQVPPPSSVSVTAPPVSPNAGSFASAIDGGLPASAGPVGSIASSSSSSAASSAVGSTTAAGTSTGLFGSVSSWPSLSNPFSRSAVSLSDDAAAAAANGATGIGSAANTVNPAGSFVSPNAGVFRSTMGGVGSQANIVAGSSIASGSNSGIAAISPLASNTGILLRTPVPGGAAGGVGGIAGTARGGLANAQWAGGQALGGAQWAGGKVLGGAQWAGGKVSAGAHQFAKTGNTLWHASAATKVGALGVAAVPAGFLADAGFRGEMREDNFFF
jgi:hypothetical protein